MFNNLSPWGWVALAWVEVLLAYGGYLYYLAWRERRAREDK